MKFGAVPTGHAEGAVLAHAVQLGNRRLPKGHRLGRTDIEMLLVSGIESVTVATLDPLDLDENAAATSIAVAIRSPEVVAGKAATGRVNLHACDSGLFTVDAGLVDAINVIDPAITIATLPNHSTVAKGQMVATIKIIPFAVNGDLVAKAREILAGSNLCQVHPFKPRRVGLIQTLLPAVKETVLAKTQRVTQARLERSQSTIGSEKRVAHEMKALSSAIMDSLRGNDVVIVFGASAMSDFDDVIPAAIRSAGGEVIRAGMPVDPGNLLVLGTVGGKTVIGAPGCARSPKENGFDWVLDRLFADVEVGSADIAGMGVGGLLLEIGTRPQPRENKREASATRVDAIVLAAGRSSRMGGPNKLLARFDGVPLVRRVAEMALRSRAAAVSVVTGHQADRLSEALGGLDLAFVANPNFIEGLSTSLRAGVAALPPETAGVLVLLGDMPEIGTADIDRMISGFVASGGARIVRASHAGKRGNPVILPRSVFPAIARLEGDTGARQIVESDELGVIDIEIGMGAVVDVDTAEAMRAAGGVLQD